MMNRYCALLAIVIKRAPCRAAFYPFNTTLLIPGSFSLQEGQEYNVIRLPVARFSCFAYGRMRVDARVMLQQYYPGRTRCFRLALLCKTAATMLVSHSLTQAFQIDQVGFRQINRLDGQIDMSSDRYLNPVLLKDWRHLKQ